LKPIFKKEVQGFKEGFILHLSGINFALFESLIHSFKVLIQNPTMLHQVQLLSRAQPGHIL